MNLEGRRPQDTRCTTRVRTLERLARMMDLPAMARARRGITKSGPTPSDTALEGLRAGVDVEVSFQRRKLRKSFAASRHLTWVWLDAIMQTAVSITIGLARKDLVTYFTNIFGYSGSVHDTHRTA